MRKPFLSSTRANELRSLHYSLLARIFPRCKECVIYRVSDIYFRALAFAIEWHLLGAIHTVWDGRNTTASQQTLQAFYFMMARTRPQFIYGLISWKRFTIFSGISTIRHAQPLLKPAAFRYSVDINDVYYRWHQPLERVQPDAERYYAGWNTRIISQSQRLLAAKRREILADDFHIIALIDGLQYEAAGERWWDACLPSLLRVYNYAMRASHAYHESIAVSCTSLLAATPTYAHASHLMDKVHAHASLYLGDVWCSFKSRFRHSGLVCLSFDDRTYQPRFQFLADYAAVIATICQCHFIYLLLF